METGNISLTKFKSKANAMTGNGNCLNYDDFFVDQRWENWATAIVQEGKKFG